MAHTLSYKPKNLDVKNFSPNLTPHVQPLDTGIICCIKALYRKALCRQALQLEENGAENLFKLDLLESMKLLEKAWDEVSEGTIHNYWKHTGITVGDDEEWEDIYVASDAPGSESDGDTSNVEMQDPAGLWDDHMDVIQQAWKFMVEFAESSTLSLPDAEKHLENLLGDSYNNSTWRPAFNAIMTAGQGCMAAAEALHDAEKELLTTVQILKDHRLIHRGILTISQLLQSPLESEDANTDPMCFADGPVGDKEIVDYVKHKQAIERGKIIVVDDDSSNESDGLTQLPEVSDAEVIELIQKLEVACSQQGTIDLAYKLWGLHLDVCQEQTAHAKQTTLDVYDFVPKET
ncbi:hypothetical protein V5O48_018414 [Marasmius crinis-equi]|uniref:DDE-1 domain-containing protein n=1 Tax=Marasmius crinis-equi TaxID=585013 RepID=A0ABR3EL88_9AGAR